MPRGSHLEQYQFRPGQSGNPAGRPPSSISEKELRKFTRELVADTINKVMELTDAELDFLLSDPESTQFEKAVARIMLNARKDGEFGQIDKLLDRAIGRVPQKLEGDPDRPLFSFGEILKKANAGATGEAA